MEKEIRIYNYGFKELRTYLFVALFVLGNLLLPQLCHLIPNGGKILLPIYFFTLIASYKYGFKVGLMTAVLSPIINSILFGMPALAILPAILTKSVVLALAASFVANKTHKISIVNLVNKYTYLKSILFEENGKTYLKRQDDETVIVDVALDYRCNCFCHRCLPHSCLC